MKQIKEVEENKAKEIWLLGEKCKFLFSYSFSKTFKGINEIPGDFWIYFTSSHPKDFSDDLIEAISRCDKIFKNI